MSENIELSELIVDSESFIDMALKYSDEWLVSGYSKAQLSLLCFDSGMLDIARSLLVDAIAEINENNPGFSEIKKFNDFIFSDDVDSANRLKKFIINRNLQGQGGCWITCGQ